MSEFIFRSANDYKNINEELPPIGKTIEVLCTMITKATLTGVEPNAQWTQVAGADMLTDVKLWREIDEQRVCEVESPQNPEAV